MSQNIFFAGFLAGNLILNIAIYAMMKMRYERHLAMLGTLNIILTTGKQLEKLNLEETFAKKLSEPLQVLKKAEGNIEKMQMPHTDIVTSMAVQDDIMSGDSYFIKEIKYLKRMLEHLNENCCTICIVDEILRGTNTKERIAASQTIMEYLCEKNCLVMVASHDQELTVLLQNQYDNYRFSEKIGEHDIEFDYKLYPGPSTSQNAIRLLEYLGFPKKIVVEVKKKAGI